MKAHKAPHGRLAPVFILIILLAGCASRDRAIFVTKTSLSIVDVDTAPASLTVAYDRTEGYFGPSYANGAAPPVAAVIQASGKVINPQIRQLYATGTAANIVAQEGSMPPEKVKPLEAGSRMMFFGTSTNIGFKLSFLPDKPVPTGMVFGYRRKEASYIPLGKSKEENGAVVHNYPSVFAAIDTTSEMSQRYGGAFSVTQVFATGHAAEHFAHSRRAEFNQRAKDALGVARELQQKQRDLALEVLRSYNQLSPGNRTKAWADASNLGLFHESEEEHGQMIVLLSNPANAAKADGHYTTTISTVDVDDPARLRLLELHLGNLKRLAKSQT